MSEVEQIKQRWQLKPLPDEGGFFAQTWRGSPVSGRDRPEGTAILFLITPEDFSALHRLDVDEVWHFYAGDAVEHVQLRADSTLRRTLLGPDVLTQTPQLVVEAGSWQGARIAETQRGWSLLGCTLAPGWTDTSSEMAVPQSLLNAWPQHADTIRRFTRATV